MSGTAVPAAITIVLSLLLTPVARAALLRRGVLDLPGQRSSHTQPTVRGAGVAPATVALAVIAGSSIAADDRVGLVVAAGSLAMLGMAEDLVGLSVVVRLTAQVAVAVGAAAWLFSAMDSSAFGEALSIVAAAAWIVAFVNAFNFMDGINGISVAQTAVAGVTWWAIGARYGIPDLTIGAAVAIAAAAGFAPFNFPRATAFLGDVGSYFFGGLLAGLVLIGLRDHVPLEAMVAPVSVYLADTATTLARRALRRAHLLSGHREHAYQRLVRLGWSHVRTTGLVTTVSVAASVLGSVSLTGSTPLRAAADVALVALLTVYAGLPNLLERRRPALEMRQAT